MAPDCVTPKESARARGTTQSKVAVPAAITRCVCQKGKEGNTLVCLAINGKTPLTGTIVRKNYTDLQSNSKNGAFDWIKLGSWELSNNEW